MRLSARGICPQLPREGYYSKVSVHICSFVSSVLPKPQMSHSAPCSQQAIYSEGLGFCFVFCCGWLFAFWHGSLVKSVPRCITCVITVCTEYLTKTLYVDFSLTCYSYVVYIVVRVNTPSFLRFHTNVAIPVKFH